MLTSGLFEGECIISCLCDGGQGVGEVGEIIWRGFSSLFVVDQLGCKLTVSGIIDLVVDMAIYMKR